MTISVSLLEILGVIGKIATAVLLVMILLRLSVIEALLRGLYDDDGDEPEEEDLPREVATTSLKVVSKKVA